MKQLYILLTLSALATALTGCTSSMLTENTLEGMSTTQIRQLHASTTKYSWWFDNKKAAEIYAAELEKREAIDSLAEKEVKK